MVLTLLLAIKDLHGKNIRFSITDRVRVSAHVLADVPATSFSIVLEHLNRLVSLEDYITCAALQNFWPTNRDILITHRFSCRI